jgi:TonB family protein
MFTRLVASAKGRSQFRRPAVIIGSIAVHGVLLVGVIRASAPAPAEVQRASVADEEVTYIDIAAIPPPPDVVFEEPPPQVTATAPPPAAAGAGRPGPTRPAEPRRTAATPPAATATEPAGFQELRPPTPMAGLPAPDPGLAPVRAEDFGGRGQVGGTAGGTRSDSAGTARIGTGDGTGTGTGRGTGTGTGTGTDAGPPTGTFSPNLVDRRAELTNRTEVTRVLQRLYPPALSRTGTEGSVRVQFVVTAAGRVDMSTVQIMSTTNEAFADATLKALAEFRFRPARKGVHDVRMLTTLPIEWKLPR